MKHTTGPWNISNQRGTKISSFGWRYRTYINTPICTVDAISSSEPEARANARLIVLAPEMYNLLSDAAFQLSRLTGESLETYAKTFAALAKQVIARAEGKG